MKSSYKHSRAPHRLIGDVARSVDEYVFGPAADIYYNNEEKAIHVDINLPGFEKGEVTVRLVPEKKDPGLFDEPAHIHVTAKRENKIDRKKNDVIMETRPINYDFKIPLHVSIKEDENFGELKGDFENGVASFTIKHEIPGFKVNMNSNDDEPME